MQQDPVFDIVAYVDNSLWTWFSKENVFVHTTHLKKDLVLTFIYEIQIGGVV